MRIRAGITDINENEVCRAFIQIEPAICERSHDLSPFLSYRSNQPLETIPFQARSYRVRPGRFTKHVHSLERIVARLSGLASMTGMTK